MCKIPLKEKCANIHELIVSIIIVNFNGQSFLETCLPTLTHYVSCPHEIVIVDNNSSDGSREYLSIVWPGVRLICSQENLGFARGNNLGAEYASGKYLLLLNNDTKILENIQPLIDYLEEHSDTAVVGGRLRNPDGSIQESVGYDHIPLRLLFTWCLPRTCTWFSRWKIHERRSEFYQSSHREVQWVSGAYFCIRRKTWQELAGFDKDIFMYVEDADLCLRVRGKGEKIAYFAGADICHFEGGGQKGMSGNALMATIDSYRLLLAKRHGCLIRNLTCIGLSLIFLLRAGLYSLVGAMCRDPIRSNKAEFYLHGAGRLLWGGELIASTHSDRGGRK